MSICQTDAQGYLIPWIGDDDVTEAVEALYDPNAGPAETWGPEWDLDVWQLGPGTLPGEETQLDADDEYQPTADDESDYREWCMDVDRRWDEQYRYTEADARAAGLAI